MILDRSSNKRN